MTALNEQYAATEVTSDAFKAHLVALLSIYKLGPHPSVPMPRYDGPTDSQSESILRSLHALARRMWAAEGVVSELKGARGPLDNEKVVELGYQFVQHSEATPPIEGSQDVSDISTANTTATAAYKLCPTCGNVSIPEPVVLHSADDVLANSVPFDITSPLLPGSFENEISAVEELRLLKSQLSDVARVCNAVARGDLSQKITVPIQGVVMSQLKDVVNNMVDKLMQITNEVIRVSQEIGTDGKLGVQLAVPDVEGALGELISVVNKMASNITSQVRSISKVSKAIALGDLSKQIEVESKGEIMDLKNIVNSIVLRLRVLLREVNRVTLEVGCQGEFGGRAQVPDAEGVWLDLVENVNKMASNLTDQVRSITQVTKAVALGDLSHLVEVDAHGEMLDLKDTVNAMVTHLSTLANEVSRVSLEVVTEGMLGGQAFVPDIQGMWKAMTDHVNNMSMLLTNQVRGISEVIKAIAWGDLTMRVEFNARGEMLELKETVNDTAELLRVFMDEVTGVARVAGAEGHLGWQAKVPNMAGSWKELADSVNVMANNLTLQVRTVSVAIIAVARGDLTQKIENAPLPGEMLSLANTINDMIDQLAMFAAKYKKIAREGDTEDRLGEADVRSVIGIWDEIADILAAEFKNKAQSGVADEEEVHL